MLRHTNEYDSTSCQDVCRTPLNNEDNGTSPLSPTRRKPRVCVATPLETDTARRRSIGPRAYARGGAPGRHRQRHAQRDYQPRVRRATLPHVPAMR
jgi:hypothetical protein